MSREGSVIPFFLTLEFIGGIRQVLRYVLPIGEEEYETAEEILRAYEGNLSDALHLGAMRVNGISRIIPEDRGLDRVEGVKRLWPI